MKKLSQKIKSFTEGNFRKFLLSFTITKKLVPLHIREQIEWRIKKMDQECLSNGACLMCGCATPGLQMANDMCDKPCYPEILSKEQWKDFKITKYHSIKLNGSLKIFHYE